MPQRLDMVESALAEKGNSARKLHARPVSALPEKALFLAIFPGSPWIRFRSAAFKSIEGISASLALSAALPSQPCITQT
ncbi:hypothetical protein IC232_09360 [Microvirga sp. BT688]|uniref:hypothetical protein n=1 Tax=Microvirga sp. TaxID=1873136 RepID=UPI001689299B|nr:hypothetical protein [Microvirga sp.]MBD2746901.1 hypothetical protein [Microvirga sp.]